VVDLVSGKEVWSTTIGEAVVVSPAVVEGAVIVGSEDGVLYCFEPLRGGGGGQ
jgi:outer membrane protein assembly factor BamB